MRGIIVKARRWFGRLGLILGLWLANGELTGADQATWSFGFARAQITPKDLFWMGGFAARTRPAEGTLDDLWVKALVLQAPDGGVGVLVTVDLVGIPKWLYDQLGTV
jgi:neutral ceramidase